MLTKKILWIKVWGIAAVQGAITLTWVIYNLYFPLLLVELGFNQQLAIAILIIENALESLIEPIFGGLSDQKQKIYGSKIPLISGGIILASLLFILFPSFVIFDSSQSLIRWLLPIMAIIWAGCMAVFRAPTMSLLGQCATTNTLPQAASILTLVAGIVGAFRFDAYGLILNLGADFAFALGSFSLLGAMFMLRKFNFTPRSDSKINQRIRISGKLLSLIFMLGIWISWSLRFIMPAIQEALKLQFGASNGKLAMTIFLILLGIAALPAGKIATQFNNYKMMCLGVIGTIMALILLNLSINAILPTSVLIICFSFVLNGIIPLILTLVPQEKSGLSLGLYFGGFGAGMSSYDLIFIQNKLILSSSNIVSAIILLCLIYSWLIILQKKFV